MGINEEEVGPHGREFSQWMWMGRSLSTLNYVNNVPRLGGEGSQAYGWPTVFVAHFKSNDKRSQRRTLPFS